MASTPSPALLKKLGGMYSWLIRQPTPFVAGIRSINDIEKLYDILAVSPTATADAGKISNVALATIGYDPSSTLRQPCTYKE